MIIKRPPIIHIFETEHHILIDKSITLVIWKVERASWIKISNIGIVDDQGFRVVENSKIDSPLVIEAYGYKSKAKSESTYSTINIDIKTKFIPNLKEQPIMTFDLESIAMLEKAFQKLNVKHKITIPKFKNIPSNIEIKTNAVQNILEIITKTNSIEEINKLENTLKS